LISRVETIIKDKLKHTEITTTNIILVLIVPVQQHTSNKERQIKLPSFFETNYYKFLSKIADL
jgi:hypothetical protein